MIGTESSGIREGKGRAGIVIFSGFQANTLRGLEGIYRDFSGGTATSGPQVLNSFRYITACIPLLAIEEFKSKTRP